MLKINQKNVHVFEIESQSSQKIIEFLEKNQELLHSFLIIFKQEIEPLVKAKLKEYDLLFLETTRSLRGRNVLSQKTEQNCIENKNSLSQSSHKTIVYKRNIRSGEEINSAENLVFLGNVNNGAKIISEGCISIYGTCEGAIICFGECLVLREVHTSQIVFQGAILLEKDIERLQGSKKLKVITKNGDLLDIKELT
ncbi:septum formation inhibitor [Helicobacter cetorum MIT 00-7128]|uniref:Septum formation inhibitor n=1 Tax=Helicobacter cetorum (strain ATCC BAA-429 / MIT 00-7128) TaxID=182217 RepID=I0EM07_HELC0|nr:septum site-determining protein MinC [Helicobacter cetorum]AFI03976.1 septum formation inhibitor [Helicobacter cetorum MIT 00-7128]